MPAGKSIMKPRNEASAVDLPSAPSGASWMFDALGRRWSGFLIGSGGAICMALAGYWHDVYIGTVSVFFVMIMAQRFFGDASYAIIGPYIAEVWPNRLRASGMGFSYGIGNLGKIIGPLGLALVVGASDCVSPKATLDAISPALLFLAFWYGQAALVFLFFAIETRGRSIEEINRTLDAPAGGAPELVRVPAQ